MIGYPTDGTKDLPPGHNFFKPGNPQRAYNAAAFYSDGQSINSVSTDPVTFQMEVETSDGARLPVGRYHDLALRPWEAGVGMTAQIWCDLDNTAEATQGALNATKGFEKWLTLPSDTTNSCFANWNEYANRKGYFMIDPRTERFGLNEQIVASPGASILTTDSAWVGAATWQSNYNMVYSLNGITGKDPNIPGVYANSFKLLDHWKQIQGTPAQFVGVPAALVRNYAGDDIATYYYADPDETARRADAGWVPRSSHPALPVATFPNALNSRPVILDRPFRSVAELGCVFRDIPWKSLDLFSPDSADRRLLDVFSIEDRATVTGKINPNLATVETLEALVRGASLDPSNAGASSVPDTNANAVAAIFSGLNPMSDPIHSSANMTARLSTNAASKPGGGFSPYKTQAENFIRALASTMDTRSWQLMLDVVAQSGRVAPGSSDLKDFVVEGQKRFFVYLTLDRITGEIVDKHVEPVYE
jgi:hypothetical protein